MPRTPRIDRALPGMPSSPADDVGAGEAAAGEQIIVPIKVWEYLDAYAIACKDRWAVDQIEFYENAGPPTSPDEFAMEACWVILNSGFRNTIVRKIWKDLAPAIKRGEPETAFGNARKVRAMKALWTNRHQLHEECLQALEGGLDTFVPWCRTLDGFGAIIPYHLGKNFGLPTAKPDVWLERLARTCGEDSRALCDRLSTETGHKAGTVDFVWWYVLSKGHLTLGLQGRAYAECSQQGAPE